MASGADGPASPRTGPVSYRSPITGAVTPFTYSLLIYPVVLLGLVVRSARYWLTAVLGRLAMLTAVHLFIETPGEMLGGHAQPLIGIAALGVLAALAFLTSRYAAIVLAGRR